MAYTAEISRANPSCFLFVVDQSGSMVDPLAGDARRNKAQSVANTINTFLKDLVIMCSKSEGVRDYYHVGVLGYANEQAGPAFGGALSGRQLVPVSEVANHPARIEERTQERIEDGGAVSYFANQTIKFPIWFNPVANGGTPMCKALKLAHQILSEWLLRHPTCFPPVVIHITDGESTDGDPSEAMQSLTSLSSNDGNVLLFNVHLSSHQNARPVSFPESATGLPDQYSRMLWQRSSPLTPFMLSVARDYGLMLNDGARGFVLNADLELVIQTLDIGTRPSNLR
ncbi:MAG TPA: vWA domain-containing protein [Pyrinomonadaceae bacterium]